MTFTEKAATIGRTGYQLLKLSVATVQDMGRVAVKGTGWEQSYSGATHSIQAYVRAAQIHLGNLTWNLDLEEGVNSYCNLKGFVNDFYGKGGHYRENRLSASQT